MKKIISILLLLTLCLSMLAACDGDNKGKDNSENMKIQLNTPVLEKKDNTITWKKIENATKYEILINGDDPVFVDASVTSYPISDNQIIKIRAVGDGKVFSDSEWSNVIFHNIYTSEDEI